MDGATSQPSLHRHVSGTVVIHALGRVLTIVLSVALARLLGATHYGIYAGAIAWAEIGAVAGLLGYAPVLTRTITVYRHEGKYAHIHVLLRRVLRHCTLSGLALMLVVGGIIYALYHTKPTMLHPMLLAALLVPLKIYAQLLQAALLGFRRVLAAQIPQAIGVPVLVLAGITFVAFSGGTMQAADAVSFMAGAQLLALFILLYLAFLTAGAGHVRPTQDTPDVPRWKDTARFTFGINLLHVCNRSFAVIALGLFAGAEEAGLFALALRAMDLLLFVQNAVNVPLSQHLSEPAMKADKAATQQVFTHYARLSGWYTLLGSFLFFFFGKWLLLTLFGNSFAAAYVALIALSAGAIINTACGSVGIALIARGHEQQVFYTLLACTGLLIVLLIALLPSFGAAGAALAWAVTTATHNVALSVQVRQQLGILPTMMARIR